MLVNLKSDFFKSRKSQFSVKIVKYHLVLGETAQLKLISLSGTIYVCLYILRALLAVLKDRKKGRVGDDWWKLT